MRNTAKNTFASLLIASAMGGCAASSRPAAMETRPVATTSRPLAYEVPSSQIAVTRPSPTLRPTATSALAFTPPVARDIGDLNLERDGRQASAYAGYEDQVVSQTWVYQDDDQRFDSRGRTGDFSNFERRAVTSTLTIRSR